MLFYVNAKFLTQKFSGVQRFGYELTKSLIDLWTENINWDFKIVAPDKKYWKNSFEISSNFKKILTFGKKTGIFWEQIELLLFLKKKDVFLLNPGNSAPLFYHKNLIINHGLAWKRYPQAFSKKFRLWYDFLIPKVLKKALLVFAVSEFCKKEIIETYNLPEEKVKVLYPGVGKIFKPLPVKEKKNFILYVGNIQPYKNLKNLILALQILREKGLEVELWIVGEKDERVFRREILEETKGDKRRSRLCLKSSILNYVKFLGFKRDEELVKLYNEAQCLCLPSFYETFGFPVVEAMVCGCPVVASDIPALREVGGEAVLYVEPAQPEGLAEGLKKVITDSSLQEEFIKRGLKRSQKFSWEKTANAFLNYIKNL